MVTSPDFLRAMRADEESEVEDLLNRAFAGPAEADLVHRLRKSGVVAGEQVITADGKVIAYSALSQMRAPKGWLCLGPVAVHPEWQRRRVGRRMVGLIGEWGRISGTYIVVLGMPEFYQKAGFSTLRAAQLTSPYSVKNTLLAGPGGDIPEKTLIYPDAFSGTG